MSGGKPTMPVVSGSQQIHDIKVAVEQLVHQVESTMSSLTIVLMIPCANKSSCWILDFKEEVNSPRSDLEPLL
ncbi:unnamed protein product [Sphagnum jensenii]|uniref:Uncharacterized protein n=1 Tax=Sphagnum jensenii TaxID=128206 RepID=A0ABP1A562_9BRYO